MNKVIAFSILLTLIGSLVLGLMPISVRAEEPAVNPVTGSSDKDAHEIYLLMDEGSGGSQVNFDDIPLPPNTYQQILIYAEITWDSGLPDYWGRSDGSWDVYNDLSYATPFSPPNYAFNAYGAINPGFSFTSQVNFKGAYFMQTTSDSGTPSAVRCVGYVSGVPTYYSGWLFLSLTPTYLSANFPGVDRVVVEMQGSGWFAMDDLIYTVLHPVGGYSFQIEGYIPTQPITPYLALIAILAICFTAIRRKTTRKTK
jgi:hypothetical protein